MRVACSILILAVAATGYGQAQMSPEVMLEGGIRAEVVDGNLTEAIAIYEGVASRPDVDRAVAAKALLHLAGCYEKLGDDTALAVYQRIRDDYGDVAEVAAHARERLAVLEAPVPPAAPQDGIVLPRIPPDVHTGGAHDYLVSPDGRYGVFTSYSRDAQNIGLLEYETGEVTWVTHFPSFPEAQADALVFSPDSSRVAYSVARRRAGAVEVHVAALGEPAEVVYRADFDGFGAAVPIWLTGWTPDGDGLVGTMDVGAGWKMLFKLDLVSGELTQIATLDWRGIGDPWLSPDGSTFAMARVVEGNRDIYTLSVDGSKMSRLTDHPARDSSPLWSRDGRHLLFTSDRLGEQSLWAVPVERGEKTGPPILLRQSFNGRDLGWAGERFTFIEYRESTDLFTLPLEVSEAGGSARRVAQAPAGSKYVVKWGSRGDLAYVEWRGERRIAVILHPDGTTTERQLPADLGRGVHSIGFNVDGSVVAFAGNGRLAFYELEADAFSVVEIPPEPPERLGARGMTYRSGAAGYVVYYAAVHIDQASFELRRFDTYTGETTTIYASAEPWGGTEMWLSADGESLRFAEGSSYKALDLTGGGIEDDLLSGAPLESLRSAVSSFDGTMVVARLEPSRDIRFRLFGLEEGLSRDIPVATEALFGQVPEDAFEVGVRSFYMSPSGDQLAFVGVAASLRRYVTDDPLVGVLSDDSSR